MSKGVWVGLVVVVAVTAGCSSSAGSPDLGTTVTAAPVPTDSDVEGRSLAPPGVADGDLDSPAELASGHRLGLRASSFLWIERHDRRVTDNGTLLRRTTVVERTWVGDGGRVRRDVAERTVDADGTVTWSNRSQYAGERWHQLVDSGGQRELLHGRRSGSGHRPVGAAPMTGQRYAAAASVAVSKHLSLASSTVRRLSDGRYLIAGSGPRHPEFTLATGYEARAVVGGTGVVRRLSVSYRERLGGRRANVTYRFAVRQVGTTSVPRPSWARANATLTTAE